MFRSANPGRPIPLGQIKGMDERQLTATFRQYHLPTFADVPTGLYTIGFLHPMLDSLGITAPLREVRVGPQQAVHVDLAIPGATRLRSAICRSLSRSDSGAILTGVVRDWRDGRPAAGVKVAAEWSEISFTSTGTIRRQPRVTSTTGENAQGGGKKVVSMAIGVPPGYLIIGVRVC